MANLYEINESILASLEASVNEDGEIVNDELFKRFEELQIEKTVKLDNMLKLIRNIDSDIEAEKEEKAYFDRKIKQNERRKESIKAWLNYCLKKEKYKSDYGSIYWMHTQSTVIPEDFDATTLPEEYQKVTVEPKTAEIKKAILEDGEVFEGIYIEEKDSIVVRLGKKKEEGK